MYRITYEQGNGYHCGCCRQTWTNTEDLETPEEIQEWINELAACREFSIWEDDYDREIISIEKEFGVDIKDQFQPQENMVKRIVAKRKKNKKVKEKRDAEDNDKKKEERERTEYLRLKNKYE